MRGFLTNEEYSVRIAKIAIAFQTIMTFGIIIGLILTTYSTLDVMPFVAIILYLDVLFVTLHLTYRKLYSGRKVVLQVTERRVLITHAVLSLCALLLTFSHISSIPYAHGYIFVWITISMWIGSLLFGIIFYQKKYSRNRRLE